VIEPLRFEPTLDAFAQAAHRLHDQLASQHLSEDLRYKIELAFEEVATNIIRHGHPTGAIDATLELKDDEVVVAFEDDGSPFDPRNRPSRVMPSSLDNAGIGGLGLHLLATLVARMDYQRTPDDRNRLTIAIPRP
jgi:serine/threonine-protein kinase RsbW